MPFNNPFRRSSNRKSAICNSSTNNNPRTSTSSDQTHLLSPLESTTPPTPKPKPTCPRPPPTRLSLSTSTSNLNLGADLVTTSQPPAYWSGRLVSLSDKRRNEHLKACLEKGEAVSFAHSGLDVPGCLRELQNKCVTEPAKVGFLLFKAKVCAVAVGVAAGKGKGGGGEGR